MTMIIDDGEGDDGDDDCASRGAARDVVCSCGICANAWCVCVRVRVRASSDRVIPGTRRTPIGPLAGIREGAGVARRCAR